MRKVAKCASLLVLATTAAFPTIVAAQETAEPQPAQAADGAVADIVVTDTWISMGQAHAEAKLAAMAPYQVNAELMALAKPDAIVMHPGPMNRGVEIDGLIADDINVSVIQEQVEMGVAVRMAAMDLLARNLRARTDTRNTGGAASC